MLNVHKLLTIQPTLRWLVWEQCTFLQVEHLPEVRISLMCIIYAPVTV